MAHDIDPVDLPRVLQGVSVAAEISINLQQAISTWISEVGGGVGSGFGSAVKCRSLREWREALDSAERPVLMEAKPAIQVLLAVATLRQRSRLKLHTTPAELSEIWHLLHSALISPSDASNMRLTPSRSARGFVALPLFSSVTDGRLAELFRLHVWLPDGQRVKADFGIHSHQPFAQSWILAGEGTDHSYEVVDSTSDHSAATHSEHVPRWGSATQKQLGSSYQVNRTISQAVSTGCLVKTTEVDVRTYRGDASYSIPAGSYHKTVVPNDGFYVTLFFFDASRGFVPDAGILGPIDGLDAVRKRDAGNNTPASLATLVEATRVEEGKH